MYCSAIQARTVNETVQKTCSARLTILTYIFSLQTALQMECEDVEAYSDDILYRRHHLLTSRPYHLNSVEGVPGFISVELPMRVSSTFSCRWIACSGKQKRQGVSSGDGSRHASHQQKPRYLGRRHPGSDIALHRRGAVLLRKQFPWRPYLRARKEAAAKRAGDTAACQEAGFEERSPTWLP